MKWADAGPTSFTLEETMPRLYLVYYYFVRLDFKGVLNFYPSTSEEERCSIRSDVQ